MKALQAIGGGQVMHGGDRGSRRAPPREGYAAAPRSNADGLTKPSVECRRRWL
jgi:hypothetical protein